MSPAPQPNIRRTVILPVSWMVGNRGLSPLPPGHLSGSLRSRFRGCLPPGYSSRHATSSTGVNERDASAYLNVAERWWRAYQPWLERRGYLLRPRYRQDWIPSWEQKGFFSELHAPEDAIELPVSLERRNSGATSCSRPIVLKLRLRRGK